MARPTRLFQFRTACPSCGADVWWHRVLSLTPGFRCGNCRTSLRLHRPYQLALGVTLAAGAVAAVLLGFGKLRLVASLPGLLLAALLAGLIGRLIYALYVVQGNKLRARNAGPSGWPYHLVLALSCAGLALVIGWSALRAVQMSVPPRTPSVEEDEDEADLSAGPEIRVLGKPDRDWSLRTLDGKVVKLDDLHGRVVFLNLWATWCPPCRAEMPSIQKLHDAMAAEGVVFLLISPESQETVKEFVERNQLRVPVYTAGEGPPKVLRAGAFPATFILNRNGEVVYRHLGYNDWDTEACRRFLRRLL